MHKLVVLISMLISNIFKMNSNKYLIDTTWNSLPIKQHRPAELSFSQDNNSLIINTKAQFFDSPGKPEQNPGQDFNLWDYEVVEAFFLNDAGQYLELEFGPYGHWLVLTLDGKHDVVKSGLALDYTATINGDGTWEGKAVIPEAYFPYKVTKWNAYAIHGEDEDRVYESLYPVPFDKFEVPDFHRLEYFKPIEDFERYLPSIYERDSNDPKYWRKTT